MPRYRAKLWDGQNCRELEDEGKAQNLEDALEKVREAYPERDGYLLMDLYEFTSSRGGARLNAGRKKGLKKTKVVRIPEDVDIEKLLSLQEDIKSLIHAWRLELHETSPRDESAKKILGEIERLIE